MMLPGSSILKINELGLCLWEGKDTKLLEIFNNNINYFVITKTNTKEQRTAVFNNNLET